MIIRTIDATASVNAEKTVDSTGMLFVAQNFGSSSRAALYVNKDGKINSTDMLIVIQNFDSDLLRTAR